MLMAGGWGVGNVQLSGLSCNRHILEKFSPNQNSVSEIPISYWRHKIPIVVWDGKLKTGWTKLYSPAQAIPVHSWGKWEVWMLTNNSKWKWKPSQVHSETRETSGVWKIGGLLQVVASLDPAPQVPLLCAHPSSNPSRHCNLASWLTWPSSKHFYGVTIMLLAR